MLAWRTELEARLGQDRHTSHRPVTGGAHCNDPVPIEGTRALLLHIYRRRQGSIDAIADYERKQGLRSVENARCHVMLTFASVLPLLATIIILVYDE